MPALYVFDTSSWIEGGQHYPHATFARVWTQLQGLIRNNRIIAPMEVFNEITPKKGQDVHRWCGANRRMFVHNSRPLLSMVGQILSQHPSLIQPNRGNAQADPFVIALARLSTNNLTGLDVNIVTEENRSKIDRIPFVARSYGVNCIRLVDLFQQEGWNF